MAKIRLTEPGFENYGGQMGLLNFVDGLSTDDVDIRKAIRLSAVMLCEWEDGTSPSITQSLLDNSDTPAPMQSSAQDGSQHDLEAKNIEVKAPLAMVEQKQPPATALETKAPAISREELEAVADKLGLKGLRTIGDPLGVKSNSIKELIAAILKAG